MRSSRFITGALGFALLSGQAVAAGFGDITLNSRIGEPLRAEVSLSGDGQEAIDTACFSLGPGRDADLPAITAARMQLVREGRNYRLLISGSKPIADPVFVLALRAGCGIELQRDFVLMPQPPLPLGDATPMGETDGEPDASAGKRHPPPAATRAATFSPPPRPQPVRAARAQPAGDRLVLDTPPPDFRPGGKTASARGSLPELQARMVQMESTLQQLNLEMSRLNQAIALTTEVLASQQALQAAQAATPAGGAVRKAALQTPAPAIPAAEAGAFGWIEVAVSALAGGALVALAIYFLARHRKRGVEEELPMAVQVSQRFSTAPAKVDLDSLF